MGIRLAQLGAGFDIVFSLGNKLDLNFCDALKLITEAGTSSSLIFYLERLDGGEGFLDAVAAASQKLRIIAVVGGSTGAGMSAARSHTDSIISSWYRVTGLLEDVGVQVVESIPAAVAAAIGGRQSGRQPLYRVFALCDGGSGAVLLADALEKEGYSLGQPSVELSERLRQIIGLRSAPPNPLDMQGKAEANLGILLEASRAVFNSDEYDALVLGGMFGSYGRLLGDRLRSIEEQIAVELPELSRETRHPIIIQSMYAATRTHALGLAMSGGIPSLEWPDEVVHALNSRNSIRRIGGERSCVGYSRTADSCADPMLLEMNEQMVAALEEAGIAHALGHLVAPGELFLEGAGPWVVRADGFPHKTAAGALRLGVATRDVPAAVDDLTRISRAAGLLPRIRVAPFVEVDYELIVTFWRHNLEGDGFMIGQGGTSVERLGDVAVGRIPKTVDDVSRVLSLTAIGQHLLYARESPMQNFMEMVLALASMFRLKLRQLRELELNPIAIVQERAVVLDALPSLLTE